MRRALDETPHFRDEQERQSREGPKAAPLLRVVKDHPKELLTGIGISVLWAVAPYSLIIYMPIYVQKHMRFESSEAFLAGLVGNLFLIVGCVFAGTLSDRLGWLKMLRVGAGLLLVGVYPLMAWLAASPTQLTLIVVQSLFCLLVSQFVGVAPAALSEIFPTAVRSSGMSLSYNIAVTIFGGFAAAILTWISYTTHVDHAPALYVMAASLVALAATLLYRPADKPATVSLPSARLHVGHHDT
jgi:MHS family proline/betaine transporter-like MFS transporter